MSTRWSFKCWFPTPCLEPGTECENTTSEGETQKRKSTHSRFTSKKNTRCDRSKALEWHDDGKAHKTINSFNDSVRSKRQKFRHSGKARKLCGNNDENISRGSRRKRVCDGATKNGRPASAKRVAVMSVGRRHRATTATEADTRHRHRARQS